MSLLDELKAVEPEYNGINPWVIQDAGLENVEVVSDEYTGEGRWETHHTAVFFKDNDQTPYVALDYSRPATEMQEGGDQTLCDFYEVRPVEVTVTNYEKV